MERCFRLITVPPLADGIYPYTWIFFLPTQFQTQLVDGHPKDNCRASGKIMMPKIVKNFGGAANKMPRGATANFLCNILQRPPANEQYLNQSKS